MGVGARSREFMVEVASPTFRVDVVGVGVIGVGARSHEFMEELAIPTFWVEVVGVGARSH